MFSHREFNLNQKCWENFSYNVVCWTSWTYDQFKKNLDQLALNHNNSFKVKFFLPPRPHVQSEQSPERRTAWSVTHDITNCSSTPNPFSTHERNYPEDDSSMWGHQFYLKQGNNFYQISCIYWLLWSNSKQDTAYHVVKQYQASRWQSFFSQNCWTDISKSLRRNWAVYYSTSTSDIWW